MSEELSAAQLQTLNRLLEEGPGETAGEEEVMEFMEDFMTRPGAAVLLGDFARRLQQGGSLDQLLRKKEGPKYVPARSNLGLVVKASLLGLRPTVWREFLLPLDSSLFDLHLALQDVFGWVGGEPFQFQLREGENLIGSFSLKNGAVYDAEDEHVFEHCLQDLAEDGWGEFYYVYHPEDQLEVQVQLGRLQRGEEGKPRHLRSGSGLAPPEGLGGAMLFEQMLAGQLDWPEGYSAALVEALREGRFDPQAVIFRSPTEGTT